MKISNAARRNFIRKEGGKATFTLCLQVFFSLGKKNVVEILKL